MASYGSTAAHVAQRLQQQCATVPALVEQASRVESCAQQHAAAMAVAQAIATRVLRSACAHPASEERVATASTCRAAA